MANMILENGEKTVSMADAGAKHDVHRATVTNWIQSGCRTRAGGRVYLEGVRLGAKWVTSDEAMVRFFAALTDGSQATSVRASDSPKQRSQSYETATKALEELLA
jgi:hypothetical protein